MTVFDPDRAFGIISPPVNTAAFLQGGLYYTAQHDQVDIETGAIIARAPVQAPVPKAKPKQTKPRASDGMKIGAPDPVVETAPVEDDTVDLHAWAKGTAHYPWFRAKAAIVKNFDKEPQNATEGRAIVLAAA
jgi:hypothetical protein